MHLGDEGVVDKLISIARSTLILNNAQYTRVSTRTCELIIAIASNSEAIYPYHLISVIESKVFLHMHIYLSGTLGYILFRFICFQVDKMTDLLLELLLSQSFIHPNLEVLFKECVLKLMLRWPSIADK